MLPEWKISRKAALEAWRASLSPEARAQYDSAWDEAKFEAKTRRQSREARDRAIVALAMQGCTVQEIADGVSLCLSATRNHCARLGVDQGRANLRRTPSALVRGEIWDALADLAREREEAAGDVLRALLTALLEERAFHARRLLRADRAALVRAA